MKVFSAEWAAAFHDAINSNNAYAKSSANWELGKIALMLNDDRAVLLDLLKGNCLGAESINPERAESQADFIIVGDENTWKEVLSGRLAPLMGIMRGRLKLSKGSISKIMPYALAATELVKSAQTLDTEF